MKKLLFSTLALVVVLCISLASIGGLALAQEDDPWVCLNSTGPGLQLPLVPYGITWARLFYMEVDGVLHEGWCIEPDVPISVGQCFNATLNAAPRQSPWCEIAYIMTNYSPSSNNESAAIQLAIWKCIDGRLAVNTSAPPEVEARALQIYDDSQGKSECGPGLGLTLELDGETEVVGGVASQKFTATVTDSDCLGGIAIEFSTNKGSFAPPNGVPVTAVTELTDGAGKASVTLYWYASLGSLNSLGPTLTAHTDGQWPVIIDPIVAGAQIQKTAISEPCELTAQRTFQAVGGDVLPIDKGRVLALWIGLAALLIVGGMVWLRLRRRSA